jgi:Methyltransferase FkbM domain
MDIEGSEYEVITDMLAGEIRPRQLLVEYHSRHQFGEDMVARTSESVASLRRAGYRILARSPRGVEFSMCLEP